MKRPDYHDIISNCLVLDGLWAVVLLIGAAAIVLGIAASQVFAGETIFGMTAWQFVVRTAAIFSVLAATYALFITGHR